MENKLSKVKKYFLPRWFIIGAQTVVAGLAMQKSTLVELEWGYKVDIPIIKYFFAVLQSVDGWGMNTLFCVAGLACLFYAVRNHPLRKNPWINALALFFAICMVFGRSYYDLGSWNYIFHGRIQFGLACFVIFGYFLAFKNVLILPRAILDRWGPLKLQPEKKLEGLLFAKHPFMGPLLVIAVCCIPILICFFPGMLQADAHEQLWTYLGAFQPWTAKHPVPVTWYLGQCLHLSRVLFHSDSMALFFYAGPQYVIQWLVFAYGIYLLNKMEMPLLLRWGSLIYFAVFPVWQVWGFTVVKDSCYYIFWLLITILTIHILKTHRICWWQWILFSLSCLMIVNTRKNGVYILILFGMAILVAYRKFWKLCIPIMLSIFLSLGVVDGIYMRQKDILPGPVREVLSIPLQQTARYIKEHPEDITEEERDVLAYMFNVDVAQLAELYNPEISDPVKGHFLEQPSSEELKRYFEVWFSQLRKHPDTYIQACLNHIYGYFYPDREDFWEGVGCYYIANEHRDDYLDVEFAMEYKELRNLFKQEAYLVKQLPVIGMLYSCGFHNYILICCVVYLLAKKRYRETVILVPCVLAVLVCLVSPVNAFIRYMLPVMAVLPLNIAWCSCAGGEKEK